MYTVLLVLMAICPLQAAEPKEPLCCSMVKSPRYANLLDLDSEIKISSEIDKSAGMTPPSMGLTPLKIPVRPSAIRTSKKSGIRRSPPPPTTPPAPQTPDPYDTSPEPGSPSDRVKCAQERQRMHEKASRLYWFLTARELPESP